MTMLPLFFYVVIGGICALISEQLLPEVIPGGLTTAAAVAILGAWTGGMLFGQYGPVLSDVYLVPCALGAGFMVFGLALFCNAFSVKGMV
jgi:uncharacterized membrane protein YeaQ/YmgE (transglycosylase-associated protein family)